MAWQPSEPGPWRGATVLAVYSRPALRTKKEALELGGPDAICPSLLVEKHTHNTHTRFQERGCITSPAEGGRKIGNVIAGANGMALYVQTHYPTKVQPMGSICLEQTLPKAPEKHPKTFAKKTDKLPKQRQKNSRTTPKN